jgi:para-aminobenzoate synthetase / 4-amino-4-deoxychorismate lyase
VQATAYAMVATTMPVRLVLAEHPFAAAHSPFVRYKTTRRAHYEAAERSAPGLFDTVLWNDDRELTECTRGNIALRFDEGWVTPALDCGLLPGIGRQVALDEGRVREAVVPLSALALVREWAFLNSLRGWLPAVLQRGT